MQRRPLEGSDPASLRPDEAAPFRRRTLSGPRMRSCAHPDCAPAELIRPRCTKAGERGGVPGQQRGHLRASRRMTLFSLLGGPERASHAEASLQETRLSHLGASIGPQVGRRCSAEAHQALEITGDSVRQRTFRGV